MYPFPDRMQTPQRPRSANRPSAGFALVLALTLMAFVVLLLVSLTSLVRVESASAEAAQQQSRARQNALLALGQAIGQLQGLAGPDRRITVPAG